MLAQGKLERCLDPVDHRSASECQRCLAEWPVALSSLIGAMGRYSSEWKGLLKGYGSKPPRTGLVAETYAHLTDQGYREELVQAFTMALVASYGRVNRRIELSHGMPLVRLALDVARSTLGGFAGRADYRTVEWLFEFASSCGSLEAEDDLDILRSAMAGDAAARKAIVLKVLPYWHDFVRDGILSTWDAHPDFLGFPYEYAQEIEDDPEILAVRAHLMYVNGYAGDEEKAVTLAAEAAIRGSSAAWSLLNYWRSVGDEHLVLTSLLSVGSLRLAGSDCLASKDEDEY